MRFDSNVVVVTGGGTGIGRAVSLRLAAEGAHVGLIGRRPEPLREVADLIEANGGPAAFALPADVTSAEAVQDAVSRVLDRWGRLDVAVAAAGVSLRKPYLDTEPAELDRLLAVNVGGVFAFGQAAARAMIAGGGGSIVNVASTNGLAADEVLSESAYNASKGAVVTLTKSMALELAPQGVRVNAVCPGWIVTPLTEKLSSDPGFQELYLRKIPLGRFGRSDEVAACVAFLASSEASFVTGSCLVVDGGQLTF